MMQTQPPRQIAVTALAGVPLVSEGDDLACVVRHALDASDLALQDGDVLVFAQKIVSKAEGREVLLDSVQPSDEANALARTTGKDARLMELVLAESQEILRARMGVVIAVHRLGFVMANAGIDQSNVNPDCSDARALLLPVDPDRSCGQLREALRAATGAAVGVIINDSHGRAWRQGTVGVALGAAGLPALLDLRGREDLFGRSLQITEVGWADELAAMASAVMGQAGEGTPIVLIRGFGVPGRDGNAGELVRPRQMDLFRMPEPPSPQAVLRDLMRTRRSIRRYDGRPVGAERLHELIAHAGLAPSAHNRQPWRFVPVTTLTAKTRLAFAMGERLRADRLRDGDDAQAIEADVARSRARLTEAPALVLACLTMEDMDVYADARRQAAEHQMAVQSTAMAVQNFLLAAHAAGLGVCWMCAPLFCPKTVLDALSLPAHWETQAILTVGWPAQAGKPFSRRPVADIMYSIEGVETAEPAERIEEEIA
jgi:coenzyme F420-0:L-glutamate ligase/coenzyme F420-1:gamma-L-glutamate ligase